MAVFLNGIEQSAFESVTKYFIIAAQDLGKGSTAPSTGDLGGYNIVSYGINDDSRFNFDVPDDWQEGTDIEIQAHWEIDEAYAANSGEVRWNVVWAATPPNNTEVLDAPTHSGSGNSGDIDIPAAAKTLREDTIITIAAADISEGDCFGVTISRVALGGGNNPTAEPSIVMLHIHYTSNELGEPI